MVISYEQSVELEIMKHNNKMAFEKARHTHKKEELHLELEYASIIGGDLNGDNNWESRVSRACKD